MRGARWHNAFPCQPQLRLTNWPSSGIPAVPCRNHRLPSSTSGPRAAARQAVQVHRPLLVLRLPKWQGELRLPALSPPAVPPAESELMVCRRWRGASSNTHPMLKIASRALSPVLTGSSHQRKRAAPSPHLVGGRGVPAAMRWVQLGLEPSEGRVAHSHTYVHIARTGPLQAMWAAYTLAC